MRKIMCQLDKLIVLITIQKTKVGGKALRLNCPSKEWAPDWLPWFSIAAYIQPRRGCSYEGSDLCNFGAFQGTLVVPGKVTPIVTPVLIAPKKAPCYS